MVDTTIFALYALDKAGICRVRSRSKVTGDAYDVDVTMYNHLSGIELHRGNQGIMYNMFDESNYDFAYLRCAFAFINSHDNIVTCSSALFPQFYVGSMFRKTCLHFAWSCASSPDSSLS